MNTFMRNEMNTSEAKRLLQEGCADFVQLHKSAGNNGVSSLDQQSTGNFFGTNDSAAPASPKRRLPILVAARSN